MLLIGPAVTEMAGAFGYPAGSRAAAGLAMAALLGFGQTVALAPVAASLGINPWVVAITTPVASSGFFLPYQNTTYQAIHQELSGKLFSHHQARPVALAYAPLVVLALLASVPVWHLMGLL